MAGRAATGCRRLAVAAAPLLLVFGAEVAAERCSLNGSAGCVEEEEEALAETMRFELLQRRLSLRVKSTRAGSVEARRAEVDGAPAEDAYGQKPQNSTLDSATSDKGQNLTLEAPSPAPPLSPYNGDGFTCSSSVDLGPVASAGSKGITVDDETLEMCSGKVPVLWPSTTTPITTIRLFKAWGLAAPRRFDGDMHAAWTNLRTYAERNNARFLVGVSVSCDDEADNREWREALNFLRYVGPRHVMGLAVGNEVDLNLGEENNHPDCRQRLWHGGGYMRIVLDRVRDLDTLSGMNAVPVTVVLSAAGLTRSATHLIQGLRDHYGQRFIATFNVYPQFSPRLKAAGCMAAAQVGTKFATDNPAGFVPRVVRELRRRMDSHGWGDMKLWIGATGWSTKGWCVLGCDIACNSQVAQQRFYEHFAKWDPVADGADHAFYFSVRDSSEFGIEEEFGLLSTCENDTCKFR